MPPKKRASPTEATQLEATSRPKRSKRTLATLSHTCLAAEFIYRKFLKKRTNPKMFSACNGRILITTTGFSHLLKLSPQLSALPSIWYLLTITQTETLKIIFFVTFCIGSYVDKAKVKREVPSKPLRLGMAA